MPIVDPRVIQPGTKLLVYPENITQIDFESIARYYQFSEKTFEPFDPDKTYPQNYWNPNTPEGCSSIKKTTTEGRTYVLTEDGQTILCFDAQSQLLGQFSIKQNPDDTFVGVVLTSNPVGLDGWPLRVTDGNANIRTFDIPVLPLSTPVLIATPSQFDDNPAGS
jgi:outer membrane protein assembly factor BamB